MTETLPKPSRTTAAALRGTGNEAELRWSRSKEILSLSILTTHRSDGIHIIPSVNLRGRYSEGPANKYRFADPQSVYGPTFSPSIMKQACEKQSRSQTNAPAQSTFESIVIRDPYRDRPGALYRPQKGIKHIQVMRTN
jgi:hypothetical protein